MKVNIKRKKGFTLLELLAAIAIFSIVAVFLTSLMSTIFKYNSVNKKTFDSNSISRGFYELIRNNRPSATDRNKKYPDHLAGDGSNGVYYVIYIKNQDDIAAAVTSFVKNSSTDSRFIKYDKDAKTFEEIKGAIPSPTSDYKYAIQVLVKKHVERSHGITPEKTGFYYELETQTWDLNKGNSTEIKRKSLIAEG